MKSYLTKQERQESKKGRKATLRPLRPLQEKINIAWLCREMGVPKGTFTGWMKRGDNMLETKNHISSEYRQDAYLRMLEAVKELRDELDVVYSGGQSILNDNEE